MDIDIIARAGYEAFHGRITRPWEELQPYERTRWIEAAAADAPSPRELRAAYFPAVWRLAWTDLGSKARLQWQRAFAAMHAERVRAQKVEAHV